MGCTTRTAFWMAAIGLGFLLAAFAIPLWLGRYNELADKEFIGLFYRVECVSLVCDVVDKVMDSDSIQLQSQEEWNVELFMIPVFVTISLFFCAFACCILEAIQCGCMYGDHMIRRILFTCAFLLLLSATFGTIGLFLSFYMADKYYETNTITHAAEFPWAILFLILALVFISIACIMFFVIVCKWYIYCHHFGCRTPWYMDEPDGGKAGLYTINRNSRRFRSSGRSTRRESPPTSGYAASLPSFAFNGMSKKDSTYHEPMRSSSYSNFRASKSSKKYSSSDELRYASRSSLHDSPKVLRASRMPEFIKEEQDYLRQSRKSGYGSGIDPIGLSVRDRYDRDTPIIRHSYSDMDILRDTRNEPSVLDMLYRESRKSQY